jgi:signal transduction histidine kinase
MAVQEGQELAFLKGGGEMGELIRSKDWSTTTLGSPQSWPQSLRTAVSLLLHSQFPMFVWWGPQMITIYNDAYRLIMAEKHPQALGEAGPLVWSEIWDVVGPLADQVMNEGVSNWNEDQLLYINRRGYTEESYFTFSYSPVFDESGKVRGVFCACTETTEKVLATRKIRENERNLRNTILQAPVAMCIFRGPDYVVEIANARMYELWGRGAEETLDKPIFEGLPEAAFNGLEPLLSHVYTTGETVSRSEFPVTLPRNKTPETVYVNFVYQALKEGDGRAAGIIAVATEVTGQVEARTADLEEQKKLIGSILEASFNGIYALKAVRNNKGTITDFNYLFANNNIAKALKMEAGQIIGSSVFELLPETKTNGFFELFCRVLQTGEAVRDVTHFVTEKLDSWYDYVIVPIDNETVVVTLQDITQQKQASLQMEQQRNLLDNILKYSPSGITVIEVIRNDRGEVMDGITIMANAMSGKHLGILPEQLLKNKLSENDPGILTSPGFQQALQTLATGKPTALQYFFKPTGKWLELSTARMDEDHLINVFTDITATKKVQLEIEQSVERLAAVFNAAQAGMFTLSPVYDKGNEIVDFRFVLTNSNFAAYLGQTPEVLKETLTSTWFPRYVANDGFEMYKKTFLTGETQRRNVHYNTNGQDLYLDLMSTKVGDEVLVTFTDYTQLKTTQIQLEKYIEELKRSNTNLEEFAYAASHDLKEPIRKIHLFSGRLRERLREKLQPEDENFFDRMENASKRMNALIDDLLLYSHVSRGATMEEMVDLNQKIGLVLEDLDLEITEKKAKIIVGGLPTVKGHRRQLQQLFQNLISNALKYNKPDLPSEIHIHSRLANAREMEHIKAENANKQYYLIEVRDNGIGFDPADAERIFNIFTRLHGNAEYKGTGVGLSIARKVVENHDGYIWGESKPGEGSAFKILLPVE